MYNDNMKDNVGCVRFESKKRELVKLLGIVMSFFIIHGEMIFQKISWHDDIVHIGGWTDDGIHGRITYRLITSILGYVSGYESLPVINGLVIAICIGIISILISSIYEINNILNVASVTLISLSIPVICAHMGYMTSAAIDMFGTLLVFVAGYYAIKRSGMRETLLSIVVLAIAIGEYQCHVTLFISMLFVGLVKKVISNDCKIDEIFKIIIRYVVIIISGLLLYLIALMIFIKVFNIQLTSYAGTNSFGITSMKGYCDRIFFAYSDFIWPAQSRANMFPFHWRGWHIIILGSICFTAVIHEIKIFTKKERISFICFLVLIIVSPVVFNFNYILFGREFVHALHQYQYVMMYTLILVMINNPFLDRLSETNLEAICKRINLYKCDHMLRMVIVFWVIIVGCLYIRYSNLCYMDAEIRQQQALTYFNNLISDIHSTEGYYNNMPIYFTNEYDRQYIPVHSISHSDLIVTNPYDVNPITSYSWRNYMYEWCGFDIGDYIHDDSLTEAAIMEIENMPRYPDYGSLKVVDGLMIVKF